MVQDINNNVVQEELPCEWYSSVTTISDSWRTRTERKYFYVVYLAPVSFTVF